jgi:quercetin dioxygenase-like cupin family protein
MDVFDLNQEQRFEAARHVETILSRFAGGDTALACWEPGQISPYHCHPRASEIYFCFSGGGRMVTPEGEARISPGAFVVHPPGEVHEYVNGPQRTVLFRVRIGDDMVSRHFDNRGVRNWTQRPEDAAYFAAHKVR